MTPPCPRWGRADAEVLPDPFHQPSQCPVLSQPCPVALRNGAHTRLWCAIHPLSIVWQLHWYLLMINITSERLTVGPIRHSFHFCSAWPWQSHRPSEPPQLPESGCLCAGVAVLWL